MSARLARRLVAHSLALLTIVTFGVSSVGAQPPAPDALIAPQSADSLAAELELEERTSALAVVLRCAVCQGISIQESPSALAREMRLVVKEQLRAGRTEAEVKAYFVSKYGEWVLLAPPAQGFNLVLYLLPVALLVGGFAGLAVVVRRWSAVVVPKDAPPA